MQIATSIQEQPVTSATGADRFAEAVTALAALGATLGLLAPILWCAAHGVSLVGMTEESTGYRYFYSLRLLYADGERPWLPQGHLIGIVHHLIQLALTALGHPPTELTPRIDRFAYAAAALPHLVTGICLWWMLRATPGLLTRVAVAAAIPAVMLAPALTGGYHLLLPDYYSWIHALSMLSLGSCLRLTTPTAAPSNRWAVWLGVFLGLCVALKVTVAALAIPPLALYFLSRWPSLRAWLFRAAIVGTLSVSTYLSALFIYYLGDASSVIRYFTILRQFSSNEQAGATSPLLAWAVDTILTGNGPLTRLAVLLPALLAVSAAGLRPRLVSAALLLGSAPVVVFLSRRPLPTTMIETYDFLLLALPLWAIRVGWPALRVGLAAVRLDVRTWPAQVAAWAVVALTLVYPAVDRAFIARPMFVPTFTAANQIERALNQLTAESPGKIAIVTLGNSHRPVTLDSAIFKGGTNHGESDIWGVSPYMVKLVPERTYFYTLTDAPQRPIDIAGFQYVFFVSTQPRERLDATLGQLAHSFHLSLIGFDCPVAMSMPTNGVQYGCKRRPDAPIEEHHGPLAFIQETTALQPDTPVAWASGPARPLQPGEAIYAAVSREIWRLEPDGSFTRLRGKPGQQIQVDSVGAWSPAQSAISPLSATFRSERWDVDAREMEPLNRNARLSPSAGSGPPAGWEILGGDDVSAQHEQTQDGWLQLRATGRAADLGVQTSVAAGPMASGPITAVVRVRGFSASSLSARIRRTGSVLSADAADDTSMRLTPDGDWQTIVLRLPVSSTPADNLELTVRLDSPRLGDRLDIQEGAIHSGRHP
ncbi:MAG: hypothetical protein AB7K36_14130 [Chloroflexota bacterium]